MNVSKKSLVFIGLIITFIIFKIALNWLLLAENGDTYDFFKIAYYVHNFNFNYNSKRHLLLPILLAPFNPNYYVEVGRLWINFFYFLSIGVFYKLINLLMDKNKDKNLLSILATIVFLTNIVVLENSFYILADAIFLFINLFFIYFYLKFKTSKPILIALIIAASFYTRPEGALLLIVVLSDSILRFIKNNALINIFSINFIKSQANLIYIGLFTIIFISPHFIRTQLVYGNFLYSGYIDDKAGFIFNLNTTLLRLSNFLYGLGGFWLIPFVLLLITNIKKVKINNLLLIIFLGYFLILSLWGPYLRLYSLPLSIIIIFVFTNINNIDLIKNTNIKFKFFTYFLTAINSLFYIYCFQFLNHSDLAYSKFGKLAAIIISTIIVLFLFYGKNFISNNKKYLVLFTFLVVILNLFIFIDKFSVTRYKYYTIKQATLQFLQIKKPGENLGYSTISAVEQWYLKDFDKKYKYMGSTNLFIQFAKEKNIKYFVTTQEFGSNDNLGNVSFLPGQIEVVKTYKSPFFYGKTKLVKILNYEYKK